MRDWIDYLPLVFSLLLWVALIWGLVMWFRSRKAARAEAKKPMVCPNCGTVAPPKTELGGSGVIELAVWLFLYWTIIIPIAYSSSRRKNAVKRCPACNEVGMIPAGTPKGRRLLEEFNAAVAPTD